MTEKEILLIIGIIVGIAVIIKLRKVILFLAALAIVPFVIFYFLNGIMVPIIPGDNNSSSVPQQCPSLPNTSIKFLPDLTIRWVEKPSRTFSCETPFPIAASVSNRGKAIAYNVEVIHNGIRSAQYINELKPNQSRKIRFFPKLPKIAHGCGSSSKRIESEDN